MIKDLVFMQGSSLVWPVNVFSILLSMIVSRLRTVQHDSIEPPRVSPGGPGKSGNDQHHRDQADGHARFLEKFEDFDHWLILNALKPGETLTTC